MPATKKKALFISIDGMTDPLGQSQVLPYLSGLSRSGYDISILSAEKEGKLEANRSIIERICDEAGIKWNYIRYSTAIPLVSQVANVRNLISKARELHRKEPFDLIHCRSYLPMFAGTALRKEYGIKLLFDIRGFWPDERVDGGLWDISKPHWNFIYRYFKRKEKEFFESSDHVITLTHAAAKEIHSWDLKNNPVPITVIPCCADLDLFDYHHITGESMEQLRNSLNLKESDLVITYLGSVGTFYGLDEMMELFRELLTERDNARFLVITASDRNIVETSARKAGVPMEAVRVVKADRKDVPLYLSLGQFSLVFYKENFSRKGCSPTKLGELMGLGIPCICSPNIGDTTEIVRESDSGIALESLDPSEYRNALEGIRDTQFAEKERIRENAWKYFDLNDGISKYVGVYNQLLS